MSEIYPISGDHLYYVEFDRGEKDTFTLFKRNLKKIDFEDESFSQEFHPYQLFDGFCKEGCVPDKNMIKWMVDAMNQKTANEKIKSQYNKD